MFTSPKQLSEQLANPSAEAIRSRANEVFGGESKAKSWMTSSREIFGGLSPEQVIAAADISAMSRVLEALIRIDYGIFS